MQAPPMPRRRSAFDEEFDLLKQIQENRMAFRESLVCHDRCVQNYWFNKFYWTEKSCMKNCLELMNQVTVVANIAHGQFEDTRSKHKK